MRSPSPQNLLNTPPPQVPDDLAARTARDLFGFGAPQARLSGERDSNFLVGDAAGQRCVLKFINPAEPPLETQFQVAVLRHLAPRGAIELAPRHVPACSGADQVEVVDATGRACRVRAYSYLEGRPGAQAAASAAQRRALGRALASFDEAMAGFHHPGVEREFLWDVMQLGQLAPQVRHVQDVRLRASAGRFITAFEQSIAPALDTLRKQVIHNDLSQSNFLVSARDDASVVGILDFGDMAHAPLLCDLAIAASYQMGVAEEPLCALEDMVAGFESVIALEPKERELLLDAVLARVVQRLVITEWRAASFPENRDYILRHTPAARRLLTLLEPVWHSRSRHASLPTIP